MTRMISTEISVSLAALMRYDNAETLYRQLRP